MCQIHVLKRFNGTLKDEDIVNFDKLMCFGSFRNSDAWGLFNDKYVFKESKNFNGALYETSKLKKSDFVVGHNRLSTSGGWFDDEDGDELQENEEPKVSDKKGEIFVKEPEYREKEESLAKDRTQHHPFILGDFILVHNGVIDNAKSIRHKFNINTKIKTDSYVILWLINHFFTQITKENKKMGRVEAITKAIQMTTKKLWGSFSVVLYDREGDSMFYFKNWQTDFTFAMYEGNILVGDTDAENLEYLYFDKTRKEIEVDSEIIYLIGGSRTQPLKPLARFKGKLRPKDEEKSRYVTTEKEFKPTNIWDWIKKWVFNEGDMAIAFDMTGLVPGVGLQVIDLPIVEKYKEKLTRTHDYNEKGGRN